MAKENIWIMNHYATSMFKNQGGRHFWIAENLIKNNYKPTIFCATTFHGTGEGLDAKGKAYFSDEINNIPFVFVNTPKYLGNGYQRILNMVFFYKNLFPVSKDYAGKYGKPDLVLASSVHPLTLVAGIKIAKKFNVPCVCEVRDLWPESLVAYGTLKENSLFTKILYQAEKWIYKKAHMVIMTWEGGRQYLIDKGWENDIDLDKITHISNGVIIDSFDRNSINHQVNDADLEDITYKNLVYAGSIRKVNNLGLLLDAAKIIEKHDSKIRFLIYGSGDEKEMLEKKCEREGIKNVIFKGRVEKKYIPSILKKSYANILHNSSTSLDKYGQSQNKFFEYLAAGKCIIQTYTTGYSVIEKYNCGINVPIQNEEEIAKTILKVCNDDHENVKKMGLNARQAAYEFDFEKLTKKLIDTIENLS